MERLTIEGALELARRYFPAADEKAQLALMDLHQEWAVRFLQEDFERWLDWRRVRRELAEAGFVVPSEDIPASDVRARIAKAQADAKAGR